MRLTLMLEPQIGMTYDQLLAMARAAEQAGLHGMYRSDHYHSFGEEGVASTDAWATIAGLARETEEIVLGTLVSPATFRPVGNLARVVATTALMAGTRRDGSTRIHLGMGTGWFEPEHRQHGFPFEDLGTRYRRMVEHLEVLGGLWDADRQPYSFDGDFEQVEAATFATIPDPRPRIIVGGQGPERTPRLAARYADELNVVMKAPEEVAARAAVARQACEEAGREPIPVTWMGPVVLGADEAEVADRLEQIGEAQGRTAEEVRAGWATSGIVGTVEQAAERVRAYADAGVVGLACQHILPEDTDLVALLGQLRG